MSQPELVPTDPLFSDPVLASLYDQLCPRHDRRDLDVYLPLVLGAPDVLDVGCGTGTLLREARTAGHTGRLCGLDPAPAMIAEARRLSAGLPAIEWRPGDLSSVAWDGAFDLAVMTGHAFQTLVTDDELRRGLAAIRRSLRPGGRFAFETRNPGAREWASWAGLKAEGLTDPSGHPVRMTTHLDAGYDGRTVTFTHRFQSPGWDRDRASTSTLRFLSESELDGLLREAGLTVEERYGDWDRSPLTATSPEIITIARRG